MKALRWLSVVLAICVFALGIVALTSSPDALAAPPPKKKCCDRALEPGRFGNPLCFEGHTCCANGAWQCNNADGSPSCSNGAVCL